MEISSGPFFTTSTGLIDSIDSKFSCFHIVSFHTTRVYSSIFFFFINKIEKLMVVLRDGRKLIGTLRSFDQFG